MKRNADKQPIDKEKLYPALDAIIELETEYYAKRKSQLPSALVVALNILRHEISYAETCEENATRK